MEQNNNEIQIDMKYAYDVAIDTLMKKEKEIVELKALCNQLANTVHELQHKLNEEHERYNLSTRRLESLLDLFKYVLTIL